MSSLWRRGQAWIVFESSTDAEKAMNALQGKDVFSKPMRITFAKAKSYATLKRLGEPIPLKIHRQEEVGDQKKSMNSRYIDPFFNHDTVAPRQAQHSSLSNRTLFVEGLPEVVDHVALQNIFAVYDGFEACRIVEGRKVAFVDYAKYYQAGKAMHALNGSKFGNSSLSISYAK